jgi:AcrR family transcriptional regulator
MKVIIKQSKNIIGITKKYIIDTACRFFSEYSYLCVSMSDIAKELNVPKAALYYHFSGKTEIYKKVLEEVFNDLSLSIYGSAERNNYQQKTA